MRGQPLQPQASEASTDAFVDGCICQASKNVAVMSLTELDFTILQKFFCAIERRTGMPAQPLDATPEQIAMAEQKQSDQTKPLLKGVVLGPDGKPYVAPPWMYRPCRRLMRLQMSNLLVSHVLEKHAEAAR